MSFQTYRYPSVASANPAFDGDAFIDAWSRSVGSIHRHWQTRELVLCWSPNGPHPDERERLKQALEADPGNVGAVLAVADERNRAWDRMALASHARAFAGRV